MKRYWIGNGRVHLGVGIGLVLISLFGVPYLMLGVRSFGGFVGTIIGMTIISLIGVLSFIYGATIEFRRSYALKGKKDFATVLSLEEITSKGGAAMEFSYTAEDGQKCVGITSITKEEARYFKKDEAFPVYVKEDYAYFKFEEIQDIARYSKNKEAKEGKQICAYCNREFDISLNTCPYCGKEKE